MLDRDLVGTRILSIVFFTSHSSMQTLLLRNLLYLALHPAAFIMSKNNK
ncbi:hypothetical protein QFZ77_000706 [Paenibacillus sp. V4I3]|nr:hypothetical protein [Paenibacillus sp. V4I3]